MIYVLYYLIGDDWVVYPVFFEFESDAEAKGLELTGDSSDFYIKET